MSCVAPRVLDPTDLQQTGSFPAVARFSRAPAPILRGSSSTSSGSSRLSAASVWEVIELRTYRGVVSDDADDPDNGDNVREFECVVTNGVEFSIDSSRTRRCFSALIAFNFRATSNDRSIHDPPNELEIDPWVVCLMLKHVQISPMRSRSDSLSMRSSTSCASSLCGSPEPPNDQLRSHSRASSYSSLNETIPQVGGIQEREAE
ncbi:hypothetical protein ZHAS_00006489 [Anopheles sinensis]|uniref:Uncharacterized protein n=1 Tax=Anopheles sinensis TaxID=74873 RepID=A0A084VMG0_ANOSI|nr:hypothetical protein ZHAS_00006489 [Anopheles sinensis]